jgi:peptidoglycan/LPS O-acetylase OafA/YrhL
MSRAATSYRPDIDGLRAVAVAAVLIFHAFPQRVPGGFVGVDIFFVISGFLISGIILKELENGRFTIAGFYARRIRRIFPALALVLATTLALGWALLSPDEFQQLSRHTLGGAGFVSNLMLWRESGYFNPDGQWKPLLHLWSLGIEEQFYLAWPLLLAAMFRRTRKVLVAVGVVAVASFCLNLATVSGGADAVYYNPATRMWELLIGAGLARRLSTGARPLQGPIREGTAVLGSALIAASFVLIDESKPFPGWWALLPTVGSALLILAGAEAWVNRRVLASRGFVFVGLISYPLYLWHWPLLTYFRLVDDTDLHLLYGQAKLIRLALLGLACVLAWATWRFWESPIRGSRTFWRLPTVAGLVAAMAGICAIGMVGATSWLPPRLNSPEVWRVVHAMGDWEPAAYNNFGQKIFETSEFRSRNPEVTLFVGDSHAEQYVAKVKFVEQHNQDLVSAAFAVHRQCPPLPGLNVTGGGIDCPAFYRYWTTEAAHAKTVVIAASWEFYFLPPYGSGALSTVRTALLTESHSPAQREDIERAWRELEVAVRGWVIGGKRVVLLSSNPAANTFSPFRALRRLGPTDTRWLTPVRREEFNQRLAPVERRLEDLCARTGARLIRTADVFCGDTWCAAVDTQGEPLYRDEHHLRARTVIQKADFIDELLRP